MSQIISLIKYDYSNNKLYEEHSETIETAFISEDCLNIISELMAIAKIYEDYDSDEFTEIDCIRDANKAIELYKDRFINLIETQSENINSNIDNSIVLFRTITNVHHIFWLKEEKFSNDEYVIIKLG
jgi:hypothetical protein